jgi:hypothetical protein
MWKTGMYYRDLKATVTFEVVKKSFSSFSEPRGKRGSPLIQEPLFYPSRFIFFKCPRASLGSFLFFDLIFLNGIYLSKN